MRVLQDNSEGRLDKDVHRCLAKLERSDQGQCHIEMAVKRKGDEQGKKKRKKRGSEINADL